MVVISGMPDVVSWGLDRRAGVGVSILALVVLSIVWFFIRQRLLVKGRGAFICGLRTCGGDKPGSWMLGMARYVPGRFEWYRVLDPRLAPTIVLDRGPLSFVEHHHPTRDDAMPFSVDGEIVTVTTGRPRRAATVQLVVNHQTLTGFVSWAESAPPGGTDYEQQQWLL